MKSNLFYLFFEKRSKTILRAATVKYLLILLSMLSTSIDVALAQCDPTTVFATYTAGSAASGIPTDIPPPQNVSTDQCYTLTPDENAQAGTVWSDAQIDLAGDFKFNYFGYFGDKDGNGADGMSFIFQNVGPTAVGGAGSGVGYGTGPSSTINPSGAGIMPSVAIEFDTWQNNSTGVNAKNDMPNDHISINVNGNACHGTPDEIAAAIDLGNIEDDTWYPIEICWDATTMTLTANFNGTVISYTGDIVNNFLGGNSVVYFGFGASTGGATNNQLICINDIDSAPCPADCPTVTQASGTQDICTGDDADLSNAATGFAIQVDDDETAGNLIWTDNGTVPLADGSNITTAMGLTNMTCDPIEVTLIAWLECDVNKDGFIQGAGEPDDSYIASGGITINIYPDATEFTVNETEGSCGTAPEVSISATNGSICFTDTGNIPNTQCGDDVQDLTYDFDPSFPAACNMVFGNTISATCIGGELPIPSLTCPAVLNGCSSTTYDFMFDDLNPDTEAATEPNPIIGGLDAGLISNAGTINLNNLNPGTYTFTLNYESPDGCLGTPATCTFTITAPASADAGAFDRS